MRASIAKLLVVLVVAAGCDIGGVKFLAPGTKGAGLASHNGELWIAYGNALLDAGRTMGPQENLLYVLVVCPEMAASSSGSGTSYGARVNTYFANWETKAGKVTVAVEWDKRADKVTIAGQKFLRDAGNVFVIIREPAGRLSPFQLPSLGPDADAKEALHHIQRQMSNNTVIAAVELPQRE